MPQDIRGSQVASLFPSSRQDALVRLRAEYLEMPGLQLKANQVQRLCGIESALCQGILNELVATHFLCMKADGRYVRETEGTFPRPQAARADLPSTRATGTDGV